MARFDYMQIKQLKREQLDGPNEAHDALQAYIAAKNAADQAAAHLKEVTEYLLEVMQEKHMKSVSYTNLEQGTRYQATFVQRETSVINEAALRKELTAKVYDRFTVRKLDRKKLEQAMDDGRVDPMVVLNHVSMQKSAPYIKYTQGKAEE